MRIERSIRDQLDSFQRLRSIVALVCLVVLVQGISFGQEESAQSNRMDLTVGVGVGQKSHFGNFGITGVLYFNKYLSLKASAGVAALNYGGGVVSVGPEFSFLQNEKRFFSLGAMWGYTGGEFDILGDDDSSDFVEYHTSDSKAVRVFVGYTKFFEGLLLKFEGGYTHVLSDYSYYFSGPGTPSEQQHERIQNGLDSGWMASITVNFKLPLKKSP